MAFFDFLTGADEAEKAAKKATKQAINFAREGQDKAAGAMEILRPGANFGPVQSKLWDLAGVNGAQSQANAFGEYIESPEVQFYRQQGEEAALRAATAGGRLASGRTMADLSKFNQSVAQSGYGDHWNRLSGLYGSALNTAGSLAGGLSNIYTGTANNLSNIAMNGGMQQAQYAGQRGGVLGDLLSQGAMLAAYAAGGGSVGAPKPGSTGTSYSRNAFPPAYGPQMP